MRSCATVAPRGDAPLPTLRRHGQIRQEFFAMDAAAKPKRKLASISSAAPPRSYPDLHDHIRALDEAGLLVTVDRPINKDTEMHPLVRWQFRGGIEEKDRK